MPVPLRVEHFPAPGPWAAPTAHVLGALTRPPARRGREYSWTPRWLTLGPVGAAPTCPATTAARRDRRAASTCHRTRAPRTSGPRRRGNGRARTPTTAPPRRADLHSGRCQRGPRPGHEEKEKRMNHITTVHTTGIAQDAAVRELRAAQTELASLGGSASPSRLSSYILS